MSAGLRAAMLQVVALALGSGIVWAAASQLAVPGPSLCVEFALVAALAGRFRMWGLTALYAITILLFCNTVLVVQIRPWDSEIFGELVALAIGQPAFWLLIGLLLSVAVAQGYLSSRAGAASPRAARRTALGMGALLMTLLVVERLPDLRIGRPRSMEGGRTHARLVFSTLYTNAVFVGRILKPAPDLAVMDVPSATRVGLPWLWSPDSTAARGDVVLVLAESMGEPWSGGLDLAERLTRSMGSGFDITSGRLPTRGYTMAGEARELCGISTVLASRMLEHAARCLPALAHRAHFRSVAVHAGNHFTFSRDRWWSRIGFDQLLLFDRSAAWLPPGDCAPPLHGTACDAAALRLVERAIATEASPLLVYWVTLDAHAPLQLGGSAPAAQGCPALSDPDQRFLCSWRANVSWWVEPLARALRRRGHTTLVIVGDHPPAYAPQLFRPDSVPYVIVSPQVARPPHAAR